MKITTSAPGKLLLFGDHSVVYAHPCISTAIDRRIYVTVTETDDQRYVLHAPEVEIEEYELDLLKDVEAIPKGAQYCQIALRNFKEKYGFDSGLRIEVKAGFSSKIGFGSSSAATVAIIKALSQLKQLNLTQQEIFELGYKTVLDVKGVGSGYDIATAAYGGTIYYEKNGEIIEDLGIKNLPLIVGYTGIKADTADIVKEVRSRMNNGTNEVETLFNEITDIVKEVKELILNEEWNKVGELMDKNQEILSQLQVSSEILDKLNAASKEAGSFGAKLSGAGIGDCMITLASEVKRLNVENGIVQAGGKVIPVRTNVEGARVEK